MPARQSGSPRQQCIGAISAFVDSIDSHIILRMIRESKMERKAVLIYRVILADLEMSLIHSS